MSTVGLSVHSRCAIAFTLGLATACGDPHAREEVLVAASRDSAAVTAAEFVAATPETRVSPARVAQPTLPAPRRASSLDVVPLWTIGGPDDPGRLIQPVSLFASRLGVLVSELDGARVLVFESRSGAIADTIGRYGMGPGEFGRAPVLLGSYERPLAFEGPSGRISALGEAEGPLGTRVAGGRRWMTACAIDKTRVLLQFVGWDDDGYWISTMGEQAALVDSFSHPVPELGAVLPVGRQAPLAQADDSTCVILPAYSRQFAVYRDGRIAVGEGVEDAPLPEVLDPGRGQGHSRRVAASVRSTHLAAVSWRGRLLVLYEGSSAHRRRLIDVYDEQLAYQSSVVLPFDTQFIAASGDTLFVLGERDDEPILGAFLLRRP